jgi:DsbC/DsbD-like thiol-disulfide interchange protein
MPAGRESSVIFKRILLAVVAAWLCLFAALPAQAQATHIAAALVPERSVVPAGRTVLLAVAMRPAAGWHGYWENGGDAGFAMAFKWSLPPGASVGAVRYPVPETLLINGLMNHVYAHDYALLVPLTLPAEARPGDTLAIAAEADWLACTDEVCVPEHGRLATTVTVGAAGPRDARFDRWLREMPAPLPEVGRFAIGPEAVRLAIPLPASLALEEPHFFARTEHAIDYAAPQRFSRSSAGRCSGACFSTSCPASSRSSASRRCRWRKPARRRARPAPMGSPTPPGRCSPASRSARQCWPCAPVASRSAGRSSCRSRWWSRRCCCSPPRSPPTSPGCSSCPRCGAAAASAAPSPPG